MEEKLNMQKSKIQIVWFKRDLRISDHQPLFQASKDLLPLLPLYFVEPEYWKQPFASKRHWSFIHDCLIELRQDLLGIGQNLIIRVGEAEEILNELSKTYIIKKDPCA